jgi:hypothetical protein
MALHPVVGPRAVMGGGSSYWAGGCRGCSRMGDSSSGTSKDSFPMLTCSPVSQWMWMASAQVEHVSSSRRLSAVGACRQSIV